MPAQIPGWPRRTVLGPVRAFTRLDRLLEPHVPPPSLRRAVLFLGLLLPLLAVTLMTLAAFRGSSATAGAPGASGHRAANAELAEDPPQAKQPPARSTGSELAELVVQVTSETFTQNGFKEYRFGTPKAEVEQAVGRPLLPPTAGKSPWLFLASYEPNPGGSIGDTGFLFDRGRLVGIMRSYEATNGSFIDKAKEMFGRTESGQISEIGGGRLQWYYVFPKAYVHVEKAPHTGRVELLDRAWLREQLDKELEHRRNVLVWLAAYARAFQSPSGDRVPAPDRALLKPFPGTVLNNRYGVDGPVELVTVDGISWTRLQSQDLSKFPGNDTGLLRYCSADVLIGRAQSSMLQHLFPPRGDTINTVVSPEGERLYGWATRNGWQVEVGSESVRLILDDKSAGGL